MGRCVTSCGRNSSGSIDGWPSRRRARPRDEDLAGLPEAQARWNTIEAERNGLPADLTDQALTSPIIVKPSGGGEFVHTLLQTLRHTVDHSSYHRGQIVTMLRQVGVKPPGTGMIGSIGNA